MTKDQKESMKHNNISGCIAIFYPWGNLDMVPSLRNAAIMLADRGYKVEFYTLTDSNFPQPGFDNPAISQYVQVSLRCFVRGA